MGKFGAEGDWKKNENFYEKTVPLLTGEQYAEQFRLKRGTVGRIVGLLGERDENPSGQGREPNPREKQELLTLWYLGSIISFRKVAMLFGLATCTAWRFVDEVIEDLVTMRDLFTNIPRLESMAQVMEGFRSLKGVPNVCGALDGCHVGILQPHNHPEAYINRKGFFSVNLMALCDSSHKFMDICVGWPGSVHDSRVFRKSTLGKRLADPITRHAILPQNGFIVGDSAFELQSWLMTPFRENQLAENREKKKKYNYLISSTRVVVEKTFGILKARFRRLSCVEAQSVQKVAKLIVTAGVLHNISLQEHDFWKEDGENEVTEGVYADEEM
ncbi:putative nuclease HARBI1 [Pollicipes pollicipes]|uniref:putative nuclease HARBI1 n=1 Tax=Pollicipes pollicipes TaxID=41117 RepID=UPI001884BB92|nr:putative nuclease HARBI1 [Pollicipes pollicipes]